VLFRALAEHDAEADRILAELARAAEDETYQVTWLNRGLLRITTGPPAGGTYDVDTWADIALEKIVSEGDPWDFESGGFTRRWSQHVELVESGLIYVDPPQLVRSLPDDDATLWTVAASDARRTAKLQVTLPKAVASKVDDAAEAVWSFVLNRANLIRDDVAGPDGRLDILEEWSPMKIAEDHWLFR
jgi:hypothetical protein